MCSGCYALRSAGGWVEAPGWVLGLLATCCSECACWHGAVVRAALARWGPFRAPLVDTMAGARTAVPVLWCMCSPRLGGAQLRAPLC